jgi:hypothetical protein
MMTSRCLAGILLVMPFGTRKRGLEARIGSLEATVQQFQRLLTTVQSQGSSGNEAHERYAAGGRARASRVRRSERGTFLPNSELT